MRTLDKINPASQYVSKDRLKITATALRFLQKLLKRELFVTVEKDFLPEELLAADRSLISLSRRHGFLNRIVFPPYDYPDEPFFYDVRAGRGAGADFFSFSNALRRAVVENAERYWWTHENRFYLKSSVSSSSSALSAPFIDISCIAGYTDSLRKEKRELHFDETSTFLWTKVWSLLKNKPLWCPTQLVSAYYAKKNAEEIGEPILRKAVSTGLATGSTLERALLKGILEIIERDAFMIGYLNLLAPKKLDLEHARTQSVRIHKILEKLERYKLRCDVLLLPTDFPVYVALSILKDDTGAGPFVAVGARADFSLEEAVVDAVTESLATRLCTRQLTGRGPEKNEGDLEAMNRAGRLLFWSTESREKNSVISKMLSGKSVSYDLKEGAPSVRNLERSKIGDRLGFLCRQFSKKDMELVFAEITPPEFKRQGIRSVYVFSPEMQPLHLREDFPYFGGERIQTLPKKLGFAALPPKQLNFVPHPFP